MSSANKNRIAKACIAALFGFLSFHGLAPVQAQGDEDNQSGPKPPQAQYSADGVEGCLDCHRSDRMVLMAETVHGNRDNPHTPYAAHGCESCHGPDGFHSSRAEGGFGFPQLITFQWGRETRQVQMHACMSCHEKDLGELKRMTWYDSIHEETGMTCNYCHQLHVVDEGLKDHQVQREQCGKCHARKLGNHPVLTADGKTRPILANAKCSACHKVHEAP